MSQDKTRGVPTGYRVKLSYLERMNLPGMLPGSGSRLQMRVMEKIKNLCELTDAEMKEIELVEVEFDTPQGPATQLKWNKKKIKKEKQITFPETEVGFIKEQCDKLNKDEKITPPMWPIVQKFDDIKIGGKGKGNGDS